MGIYEELQQRDLIAQVSDEKEIRDLVNHGKAKFYIGFDPTADSLHIGHFMTLCLMKRLQLAGNKPIVVLGGGTGQIGDPSGKSDMRKMLDNETINRNIACFKEQIGRFIDFGPDKAIALNNADWLLNLNYVDFLRDVGACFSVNKMLTAECYKQRMERGLTFLEFNYMIMQSYDFYYLFKHYGCNLQFGGDDQWSNMLGGTELIRKKTGHDSYVMTIPLLTTSDGQKMGKTVKGAVWLDKNKTSPFEFYQFWRNIEDFSVIKAFKMLTFLSLKEIHEMETWPAERINEMKEKLAFELTKLIHGEKEAEKAHELAKALFSHVGNDVNMPTTALADVPEQGLSLLEILVKAGLTPSKSEGRRLIEQGGITVNEEKINDVNIVMTKDSLKQGLKIKKGKKVFHKVILK